MVELVVRVPVVEVTKRVLALEPAGFAPGARVEHLIDAFNPGGTPVRDVSLVDPVDTARLEAIAPSEGGLFDPRTSRIEWIPPVRPPWRPSPPAAA
ncbi:MAG: hypothetical protein R3F43_24350 [bacterium]